MTVWETEDEGAGTALNSQSRSTDGPKRSRSRTSRRSRRSVTPPSKSRKSTSPPYVPSEKGSKRSSYHASNDESISPFDPRRFTPTLHANLVSEILTLRRDQEDKLKFIEGIETSLQSTREELETLQTTASSTAKENRSLKRQLALLEGGTSSALGELARERDDAVDSAAETKKRLEAAQKKLRSQDEESTRVHSQWALEKQAWDDEARSYERKVHIAESRLRAVLNEVAAYQAQMHNASAHGVLDGPESEVEESAKEDAASIRSMSITNSTRFSALANGIRAPNGHSLADELNFDTESADDTDHGGRESVLSAAGHQRNLSRDSFTMRTHRRNRSSDSLIRPGSVARTRLALHHAALEKLEDRVIREDDEASQAEVPDPRAQYTDSATQYSRPPSPEEKPTASELLPMTKLDRLQELDSSSRTALEIEANQRRKRVPSSLFQTSPNKPPASGGPMVNTAAQTMDEPLSPPGTPSSPSRLEMPPSLKVTPPMMVTVATQTETAPASAPLPQVSVSMMPIPTISIVPPASRPSTPQESRLPQLFKDVGCQVSLMRSVTVRSISVQTEEIRIDQRLDKLPAHLHPSAITSRPNSPARAATEIPFADATPASEPIPGSLPPPRNPRRLVAKRSLTDMPAGSVSSFIEETYDAYPGNNDNGPLSTQKPSIRRPRRISSLFAGFDGGSSDEVDEFLDGDITDAEFRTALSAPRPIKPSGRGGKRGSGGAGETSAYRKASGGRNDASVFLNDAETREPFPSRSDSRPTAQSSFMGNTTKSNVMRKAAMIQNGIATHSRARSPSLTDPKEPPFPIPTRASSRNPVFSSEAPSSDGRKSPSYGPDSWSRRGTRTHYRVNSIRKVRSAAALPRTHRSRRQGSRSPPPISPSDILPEGSGLPPLRAQELGHARIRRDSYARSRMHRSQPSTTTAYTGDTGMAETVTDTVPETAGDATSPNQATSVVDAIAQTMVGEWMFKYVRRRKSFGVGDSKGTDENSNDRHKRWVWLAPYERAILWSSKQPSSGTALMGKPGRKLTIQSVLDVKDDNPPPKASGPLFNRSILILTPERALKFTAVSAERHYIWLTSLSFLAHSQQALPEVLVAPQPKPIPEPFSQAKSKVRRPGIRDSIRLTKSKGANVGFGGRSGATSAALSHTDSVPLSIPSVPSVPSVPQIPEYSSPVSEPYVLPTHARDLSHDAAEPPFIPRFTDRGSQVPVHARKRSNTGGHVPPPISFRGFSSPVGGGSSAGGSSNHYHAPTNSTAGNSIMTAGSSDVYQATNSGASSGMTWATGSVRTSEASSRPSGAVMNNFFDAIGTVRMEAFISPLAFTPFEDTPYEQEEMSRVTRRRSKERRRRRASRSRQRENHPIRAPRATEEPHEEWLTRDDPFRGF